MRHLLSCWHAVVTKSSWEPVLMLTVSKHTNRQTIMTGFAIVLKNIHKVEKLKNVHVYILADCWKRLKQLWHPSPLTGPWKKCVFLLLCVWLKICRTRTIRAARSQWLVCEPAYALMCRVHWAYASSLRLYAQYTGGLAGWPAIVHRLSWNTHGKAARRCCARRQLTRLLSPRKHSSAGLCVTEQGGPLYQLHSKGKQRA